jgi:acyl-CoA synthetase (AMP-forming)/AMP-acid ligase II
MLDGVPGFVGLEQYRDRVSIVEQGGEYLYEDIYMRSWDLAKGLMGLLGENWTNQKICVLCDTGLSHVITTWSCWMLGNVVVPLPIHASQQKLEHIIRDSGATIVITTKTQVDSVNSITKAAEIKLIALDESWWKNPESMTDKETPLPPHFVENSFYKEGNALIMYTVGRTNSSRGIILSHSVLSNQINSVIDSWDISQDDTLLHSLNLHQVFPLVSCLYAPLTQRAKVLALNSFNEGKVWSHLLGVNKSHPVTMFPATPIMYQKLLEQSQAIFKDKKSRDYVKASCSKKIRLMACNTTKLPEHITTQWAALTGHKIIPSFVCTEANFVMTGAVLGPNIPGSRTIPECTGPVPGVQIKIVRFRDHLKRAHDVLVEDHGGDITRCTAAISIGIDDEGGGAPVIGELLIRGENVATSYLAGLEDTAIQSFDGWIPTGDIVAYQDGKYWVKGKLGIKGVEVEGGEVLNASDLERKLLSCSDIDDTTVVGLGDTDAEQHIGAVVVINKNKKVTLDNILAWCNDNIGTNSVPSVLKIVEKIPRDNTGHIEKMAVFNMFPDVNVVCFHDTKF